MQFRFSINKEKKLQTKSDGETVTRFTLESVNQKRTPKLGQLFK